MTSEVVKVVVSGPQVQKFFYIHKNLLCEHSSFFRDKFRSPSADGDSIQSASFQECPNAFGIIAAWLYNKYIAIPKDRQSYHELVPAWRLAVKFDMEDCANTIIDAVRMWHFEADQNNLYGGGPTRTVDVEVLSMVSSFDVPADSPIRRYVVERFVWEMQNMMTMHCEGQLGGIGKVLEAYAGFWERGGDLAADVMRESYSQVTAAGSGVTRQVRCVDPARVSGCQFHMHERGSVCEHPPDFETRLATLQDRPPAAVDKSPDSLQSQGNELRLQDISSKTSSSTLTPSSIRPALLQSSGLATPTSSMTVYVSDLEGPQSMLPSSILLKNEKSSAQIPTRLAHPANSQVLPTHTPGTESDCAVCKGYPCWCLRDAEKVEHKHPQWEPVQCVRRK